MVFSWGKIARSARIGSGCAAEIIADQGMVSSWLVRHVRLFMRRTPKLVGLVASC
jgi:hypothetical protein